MMKSEERKARRKQQMLRFFGATLFTVVSFKMMLKQLKTPKYLPKQFEQNVKHLVIASKGKQMTKSLVGTLGITIGGLLMGITGTCWTSDISTLKEFKTSFHKIGETVVTSSQNT